MYGGFSSTGMREAVKHAEEVQRVVGMRKAGEECTHADDYSAANGLD